MTPREFEDATRRLAQSGLSADDAAARLRKRLVPAEQEISARIARATRPKPPWERAVCWVLDSLTAGVDAFTRLVRRNGR